MLCVFTAHGTILFPWRRWSIQYLNPFMFNTCCCYMADIKNWCHSVFMTQLVIFIIYYLFLHCLHQSKHNPNKQTLHRETVDYAKNNCFLKNKMFQVVILLATSLFVASTSGGKHAPIYLFQKCTNLCSKLFALCLQGCPDSRLKLCQRKMEKCKGKCRRKFNKVDVG